MLSSGRLLAAMAACTLERRATSLACSTSGSTSISSTWSTSGQRRLAQNSAAGGKDEDAASPTSTSTAPTQTPAAPLQAPPTSPEAQALAEKLRQSSPTGRLLDLFTPQGRQPGRPQPPPGTIPSAAADAAAAAAAAAPTDSDVVRVVMRAVENCKPLMAVQQSKSGNRITYVPKPLNPTQSTRFAIKWILQAAEKRQRSNRGASISECLAMELLLAYQRKGTARTKRDEVHKIALDNRANLRGRWW